MCIRDRVYAESPEEIDTIYANMISEMEANNAAHIEDIYTENYTARMELYNAAEAE